MGGQAVPCAEAPFVYWGNAEPKWQVSFSNTLNLFSNLRLYAQIDASGGNKSFHDAIGAKYTTFTNTYCANVGGDPICKAYRAVNRGPLGFFEGGWAKLRELSASYTVPNEWVEGFGVTRASITWSWRNVGILWFPGKYTGSIAGIEDRTRVPDPEMNAPSESFGGEVVTGLPPLSNTSVTVRVSF
jgi:hypothetical protein